MAGLRVAPVSTSEKVAIAVRIRRRSLAVIGKSLCCQTDRLKSRWIALIRFLSNEMEL